MTIEFDSLDLEDFFEIIAAKLSTSFSTEHAEYTLVIPDTFGFGTITGVNYPNGIGLIAIDATFTEDVSLNYRAHQVHPLKFVYSLNEHVTHSFNDENIEHRIEQFQSAIIGSKYPHGSTLHFEKDHRIHVNLLEVDRKTFISQLARDAHDMNDKFYELFFDTYAIRTFYHKGLYSLQLAQIIQEIADFGQEGFVRTNFIGAKTLEMLSYMLIQYEDDMRDDQKGKVLRKFELSGIHEAATYITNNLSELPSVEQIARKVDLSPAKLQEGFRLVYKCTVTEYIMEKRLETAFRLLSETNMQINQVIIEIGLTSRSYFSKIFKKKYKVLPIEVKKR